jgi:altronate dehydratase large subunit
MELQGYPRSDGRLGARNHVLVLPSVVCAGLAAERIGADGAIAIVHQHGCAHVGDDVINTERAFLGVATNPNVGAVVVVSLGCETIQGRRLAGRIADQGQRIEFVGIQAEGGTEPTVARGSTAVQELRAELVRQDRSPAAAEGFLLGIEVGRGGDMVLASRLAQAAVDAGAGAILAVPGQPAENLPPPWAGAPIVTYAERAPAGLSVMADAGEGAEQQVGLAGCGAQVIVSLRAPGQAPIGFATCPVVAVAGDEGMYAALADDYDLGPGATGEEIFERAVTAFNGDLTASERRGSRDFALRRLARTM